MVLRRLLALRQLPLFADVDLAELVVIAENVVESTFAAGELVAPAHERLLSLHVILEGRIELAGEAPRVWSPRDAMCLLDVLATRTLPAPARAAVLTRTLELDSGDLFEILEDNFGVMASLIRTLATRCLAVAPQWPRRTGPRAPAPPLGLVDRMVAIREHVPFLGERMHPLTFLAHAAREVTWLPGQVIARAGEPTRDLIIVLEGDEAGLVIGALELLAGAPHATTVTTRSATRALAIATTAIFDVLEDHAELGLATLGAVAAELLDGPQDENATGTTIESISRPVPSIACSTSSSAVTSTRT